MASWTAIQDAEDRSTGKYVPLDKDFLHDHTISTKVNGTTSSKKSLEEHLPQEGSALNCTLFLIYINDLPETIEIKLLYLRMTLSCGRQGNIFSICRDNWTRPWQLSLPSVNFGSTNTSKTVYSIFTLSPIHIKTTLQLKVQNNTIQKDNNPSYLGVRLDPKLNLKTHFDDITTKVSKRLKLLKRLSSSNWGTNKTTLRQLYSGYRQFHHFCSRV